MMVDAAEHFVHAAFFYDGSIHWPENVVYVQLAEVLMIVQEAEGLASHTSANPLNNVSKTLLSSFPCATQEQ